MNASRLPSLPRVPPSFSSTSDSVRPRKARGVERKRTSFRPMLEALEERLTPALLAPPETFFFGSAPAQLAVADFNKDGLADVAVIESGNAVSVLLGDGTTLGTPITTSLGVAATDLAVADFNNDALPDLVLADGSTTVRVLTGKGNGFFNAPIDSTTLASPAARLATGDFNRDGDTDVVAAFNSVVSVGLGDGAGNLAFSSTSFLVFGTITGLAVADFDQDADLDLIAATSGGGPSDAVSLLDGDGTGNFSFGTLPSTTGLNATGVARANVDGDAFPDFVVSFADATPAVFQNCGCSFTLDDLSLGAAGLPVADAIVAADLNLDGRSDVAVLSSATNTLWLALSDSMGGYVPDPDGPVATGSAPFALAATDLNSDAAPEVLATNAASATLDAYRNRYKTTTAITNAPTPAEYGQPITLSAQVLPAVDATAATNFGGIHGTVQFFANGVFLGESSVDSWGVASLEVPAVSMPALPVGFVSITAQLSSSPLFGASASGTFGQQVTPGAVLIGLAGDASSVFGQTVSFVATLSPPLLPPQVVGPTGTVTFRDGTTILGSVPVIVSGSGPGATYTATFTSATLTVGSHSITATYDGDSNWNASVASNDVSHDVAAAAATVFLLPSFPGPVAPGASVTLDVFVSGNSVSPTGTVVFLDGTSVLGVRTLTGGAASLTTSAIGPGARELRVAYLGDSVYAAADSNVVPFSVLGPNELYIYSVYQLLLFREPDPGSQTWVTLLDNGVSPETVVLKIQQSPEYLGLVVEDLYLYFLGRAPDPAAVAWVNQLIAGATIDEVTAGILASVEYTNLYPSDEEFVDALYFDILDRAPDAPGRAAWLTALGNGVSRAKAAAAFLASAEYRTFLVESHYVFFLGRLPAPSGLTHWLSRLSAGLTEQGLLAGILGSPEGYLLWSAGCTC